MDEDCKKVFTNFIKGEYEQGTSELKTLSSRLKTGGRQRISFLALCHNIIISLKNKKEKEQIRQVLDRTRLIQGCLDCLEDTEHASWNLIYTVYNLFYDIWSDDEIGQTHYSSYNRLVSRKSAEVLEQQLWDDDDLDDVSADALAFVVSTIGFIYKADRKTCQDALNRDFINYALQLLIKYESEIILTRLITTLSIVFQVIPETCRDKLEKLNNEEMIMEALEVTQQLAGDDFKKKDLSTKVSIVKVTEEFMNVLDKADPDSEDEEEQEIDIESMEPQECSNCHKPDAQEICGACRKVAYCSAQCQREDWPNHKSVCKPKKRKLAPGEVENETASNIVGFLLLIIFGYIVYITRGDSPPSTEEI
ncbi:hypothetical protein AKO1_011148 [Acrasis kona]|uniref:MYND-type domain-containing protein n=1 Tax=Acrasis kona TaxID=1008807 RepID=A0AAW2YZ05_9EUKA